MKKWLAESHNFCWSNRIANLLTMNNYEREQFVGRGACGSAFVCRRLSDSKRVVIKEIAIEMNELDREATLNEIKVIVFRLEFKSKEYAFKFYSSRFSLCFIIQTS